MVDTINNIEEAAYRYERKFRVEQLDMPMIENIVRLHPAGFIEAYPTRDVNNIYFDTINMQTFSDNIDGVANRTKYRIRWYDNHFGEIKNPVLEFKIKRNLAGTKVSYKLKDFLLEPDITIDDLHKVILLSEMPDIRKQQLLLMRPVLLNHYTRKYYVSSDGLYRLTLDYNMCFYRIQETNNSLLDYHMDRRSIIIELKYPVGLDIEASKISQYFPFRMTKNSKYVTGVQLLYCR